MDELNARPVVVSDPELLRNRTPNAERHRVLSQSWSEIRSVDGNDLLAEACHTVRSRYSPEEFGNLHLDKIIEEVRKEVNNPRAAHAPP